MYMRRHACFSPIIRGNRFTRCVKERIKPISLVLSILAHDICCSCQAEGLRGRVTELEKNVKRKGIALKAATAHRENAAEEVAERISRGWTKSRELQAALTAERAKHVSLVNRAQETEARVR